MTVTTDLVRIVRRNAGNMTSARSLRDLDGTRVLTVPAADRLGRDDLRLVRAARDARRGAKGRP